MRTGTIPRTPYAARLNAKVSWRVDLGFNLGPAGALLLLLLSTYGLYPDTWFLRRRLAFAGSYGDLRPLWASRLAGFLLGLFTTTPQASDRAGSRPHLGGNGLGECR